MDFNQILSKTVRGEDLLEDEAFMAFTAIMAGEVSQPKIAAMLTALHTKVETVEEVTGAAKAMRRAAVPFECVSDAVDIVGTGGDGFGTFNCSSTAAMIAAASGVKIVKHGNRASTSKSGSADLMAAMGYDLDMSPEAIETFRKRTGFAFLMANRFHPAMAYAAPVRRELPFRTLFNILGPLTNPAAVRRSVLGVFSQEIIPLYTGALRLLGCDHGFVFCGPDGLDELGLSGPSRVVEVFPDGWTHDYTVDPETIFGRTWPVEAIAGGTCEENAAITRAVLENKEGFEAYRAAAVLNAAPAIICASMAKTLPEGVKIADETISSGRAAAWLRKFNER